MCSCQGRRRCPGHGAWPLWGATLFRGILDYAKMTPTCPESGKVALKQMLLAHLALPHMNQRLPSPRRREHSTDRGGEAAPVPAMCMDGYLFTDSAVWDLKELYRVLRETLLCPNLEMWPPNSETARALEHVTPDWKLLTYLPCVGRHMQQNWVSHDPAKAMREPWQRGPEVADSCPVRHGRTQRGRDVLSAAWSDTQPVRGHKLWGFPYT